MLHTCPRSSCWTRSSVPLQARLLGELACFSSTNLGTRQRNGIASAGRGAGRRQPPQPFNAAAAAAPPAACRICCARCCSPTTHCRHALHQHRRASAGCSNGRRCWHSHPGAGACAAPAAGAARHSHCCVPQRATAHRQWWLLKAEAGLAPHGALTECITLAPNTQCTTADLFVTLENVS